MCFPGLIRVQMFLCTSVRACLWAHVGLWGYFGAHLCAHILVFTCTFVCMHTQGCENTGAAVWISVCVARAHKIEP